MSGFVKEPRSLIRLRELLRLLWRKFGEGMRDPCWLGWGTQLWKSPCQLPAKPKGEFWVFKSPANGNSGWAVTGWQIVYMEEFILGFPTLATSPKFGIWRRVGISYLRCSEFSLEGVI